MAIPFTNYVDITSGVAGNQAIPGIVLETRVFTDNSLVPTGNNPISFTSAADVGNYFGTDSEEYKRAAFYFGWTSKTFTTPQSISYNFWAQSATSPIIGGAQLNLIGTTLSDLNGISAGTITLVVGGTSYTTGAIDLSTAVSLTQVASLIQTAIRAVSAGGAVLTACTVAYVSEESVFVFAGGTQGPNTISVTATALATLLGWTQNATFPYGPVISNGVAAQTLTEMLNESTQNNNNFGSFVFTNSLNMTTDLILEAAQWLGTWHPNFSFMYLVQCTADNASAISTELLSYGGCAVTLSPIATEFPEMIPGMVMAATDYTRANSTQNYMFQQFSGVTPSVTTGTDYDLYTGMSVNFYGETQLNGAFPMFYQNGVLSGSAVNTNSNDQNVYANEIWFKNAVAAAVLNLMIGSREIPANQQGVTQIVNTIQSVVDLALSNGTISTGTLLNATQKSAILSISGDPNAWYQIQSTGFWLNCVIQAVGSPATYQAVYTLIYKKDDLIRKVVGSQILV